MTLRTFSYGGGVQSTAALVLAGRGEVSYDAFLFCNVGDDSEHPATLEYVRDVAYPYAEKHGIHLETLHKVKRDGTSETLWGRLMKEGSRSLPIPVRMSNGAPGTRSCTAEFKIKQVAKWLRQHGATAEEPAVTGLGISVDELQRARSDSGFPYQLLEYPLLTLGLTRQDCIRLIESEGIPVPPKSACFFCPFHRMQTWMEMKRDEPDLFDKSVELERTLNERRDELGKDHVFLTRKNMPLDKAVGEGIQNAFDFEEGPESCDEGVCFV